jgi:hypothetical protein
MNEANGDALAAEIFDRTSTPYAVERQMHRGTVIYCVRALKRTAT